MQINQLPTEMVENVSSEEELLRVENDYWAGMAQDLVDLERDPKFKRVILEGYFRDRAVNGVSLLANDNIKRNNQRSDIMEQLIAVSQLQDYFITIKNLGLSPAIGDEDEDDGFEG